MNWLEQLKFYIQRLTDWMVNENWTDSVNLPLEERESFARKKQALHERNAVLVNNNVEAQVLRNSLLDDSRQVDYLVHFSNLIRHGMDFYVEEWTQERRALFKGDQMVSDILLNPEGKIQEKVKIERETEPAVLRKQPYDRLAAVRYAERWWNNYNPAFKSFDVDCTNYISQCLHAGGGIPMAHHGVRSKGWWFKHHDWSYSWTVANAMRWYLSGSKSNLQAREVSSASQLIPGDVICYDFTGDGHWQHTTIVVAKDSSGEPLVNAHSTDSRMRFWKYEDSTAYTSKIKYKFFHIV